MCHGRRAVKISSFLPLPKKIQPLPSFPAEGSLKDESGWIGSLSCQDFYPRVAPAGEMTCSFSGQLLKRKCHDPLGAGFQAVNPKCMLIVSYSRLNTSAPERGKTKDTFVCPEVHAAFRYAWRGWNYFAKWIDCYEVPSFCQAHRVVCVAKLLQRWGTQNLANSITLPEEVQDTFHASRWEAAREHEC